MKFALLTTLPRRILLLIGGLTCFIALVAVFSEAELSARQYQLTGENHAINLNEAQSRLQARLELYFNDIQFLTETPQMQQFIGATGSPYATRPDSTLLPGVRAMLEAFLRHAPSYRELTLIDTAGQEIARARRTSLGVKSAPPRHLRQLANSPFFAQLGELSEQTMRVSAVRPAMHNQVVFHPVRPVIDITLPLYSASGVLAGYLSSTIELSELFNALGILVHDHNRLLIANADRSIVHNTHGSTLMDSATAFNHQFAEAFSPHNIINPQLTWYENNFNHTLFAGSQRQVKLGMGRTEYTMYIWWLTEKRYLNQQLNYQRIVLYGALAGAYLVLMAVVIIMHRTARGRYALAQTQAEVQVLFDNAHDGIVMIKDGNVISNCNQRFLEQCRLPRAKIVGHDIADVLGSKVDKATAQNLLQFKENELSEDVEISWRDPVQQRTYQCRTSLIEVRGEISAVALVFTDITQQREWRQQIVAANNQLEQKITQRTAQLELAHQDAVRSSDIKSKFISNISHEMRTPLNGVVGSLSLLGRIVKDDEGLRFLAMAQTSAENLNALINDVLDLSKIEAGKLELEEKAFNPLKLIESLVASMSVKAQEKGLQLLLDTNALHFVSFTCDPHRLTQIINNLLSNAIKFTNQGTVIVRVASSTKTGADGKLSISVEDTGVGIAQDNQSKLFSSFSQADKSIAAKYGGTGLGLAICKQLCELMHGEVTLSSQYGKGTTVDFYIPSSTWQTDPPESAMRLAGKVFTAFTNSAEEHAILATMVNSFGGEFVRYETIDELPLAGSAVPDVLIIDAHAMEFRELLMHLQNCAPGGLADTCKIALLQQPTKPLVKHQLAQTCSLSRPVLRSEFLARITDERLPRTADSAVPGGQEKRRDSDQFTVNAAAAKGQLAGQRLLIVDDNEINLEVAASLLDTFAMVVDKARDGTQAIATLARLHEDHQTVAAVLMDCNMPGMDGYEATKAIRTGQAGSQMQDVPIIAMTANAMRGEREKCLQAGMNDYVTKPLAITVLTNKLLQWCEANAFVPAIAPAMAEAENPALGSIKLQGTTICFDKPGALTRLMNNENLLKKLIGIFVAGGSDKLAQLRSAVKQQDCENVRQASHALKGQAGDIGAIDLHGKLHELEVEAKEAHQASFEAHLAIIEQAYAALLAQLQDYLNA